MRGWAVCFDFDVQRTSWRANNETGWRVRGTAGGWTAREGCDLRSDPGKTPFRPGSDPVFRPKTRVLGRWGAPEGAVGRIEG